MKGITAAGERKDTVDALLQQTNLRFLNLLAAIGRVHRERPAAGGGNVVAVRRLRRGDRVAADGKASREIAGRAGARPGRTRAGGPDRRSAIHCEERSPGRRCHAGKGAPKTHALDQATGGNLCFPNSSHHFFHLFKYRFGSLSNSGIEGL